MKLIALMPLKANSERVPGKNFKLLNGRPLFDWMLETLESMDEIEAVVINTDAREILLANGIRESERVIVKQRPSKLCGDEVSMNLIIENDINDSPADLYLMTHTTNPFLSSGTIRKALKQLVGKPEADSLFSVNRIQTRFYRPDGTPINHDPNKLLRTQDLETWFEENSCLYLFTRESFSKTRARIGSSPTLFETPMLESIDIDNPEDWMLAEAIAEHHHAS